MANMIGTTSRMILQVLLNFFQLEWLSFYQALRSRCREDEVKSKEVWKNAILTKVMFGR